MAKVEGRKPTADDITREEIIQLAQWAQQLEQLVKDQKGYIIQLQTQLQQRNHQLQQTQAALHQSNNVETFIEVEGKLEL